MHRPRPGTRPHRPRAGLIALVTAALAALVLLSALPAAAHDELVSATPAAGSTVTAPPASVVLAFSEALLELGGGRNGVIVTDAAGRHYETACATVAGTRLTSPVALGAAGAYTVTWRGVSADGHAVGDAYTFTYAPAAGASGAPGTAEGPACGAAGTDANVPSPAATAVAAAGAPAGGVAAGLVGAGVLLAAVAAAAVVLVRVRRARSGGA